MDCRVEQIPNVYVPIGVYGHSLHQSNSGILDEDFGLNGLRLRPDYTREKRDP